MTTYEDVASQVSKIRNARYGEMVRHTEELIESGDWMDFTTPVGFHFQFHKCEFDYFLIAMEVDPTIIRHAYCYATDIEKLATKELRLADITGRGKPPPANSRRPWPEVATALSADPAGAGARIAAAYEDGSRKAPMFVTSGASQIAKSPELRDEVKRGTPIARDQRNVWRVRWADDRPAADVIVEKLLDDPDLAREVYNKLRSVYTREERKRRSSG